MSAQELQVKEKQAVTTPAEHTRPGIVFTPVVDIKENESQIVLLADMPGVAVDDVTIDLRDGVLTVSGDVKPWSEGEESDVLVEFQIGKYYRQFSLSEAIDQEKIEAKLENGVLELIMPKAAKAIPRKITVNPGA
jgi:HSP20 family protein